MHSITLASNPQISQFWKHFNITEKDSSLLKYENVPQLQICIHFLEIFCFDK